jgi:hypothetical protein
MELRIYGLKCMRCSPCSTGSQHRGTTSASCALRRDESVGSVFHMRIRLGRLTGDFRLLGSLLIQILLSSAILSV